MLTACHNYCDQVTSEKKSGIRQLNALFQKILRCPSCHYSLARLDREFACLNEDCRARFGMVGEVPVLIRPEDQVFCAEAVVRPIANTKENSGLHRAVASLLPEIDVNLNAANNFNHLANLLNDKSLTDNESPKVLIVGGRVTGAGVERLLKCGNNLEILHTDVTIGPNTELICDAHFLPFTDGSFDAVVVQAVLEHVFDPVKCVSEISRVLKPGGFVYAETPFIQQVHMGRYDFWRFTALGHRRLFRDFEEVCSGATAGPGVALAWSYRYFLLSFARSNFSKSCLSAVAKLTAFPLKYIDKYIVDTPGGLDGASGVYFLGCKMGSVLSDSKLLSEYKGANEIENS